MKPIIVKLSIALLSLQLAHDLTAQGTFQNLDFESPVFVPAGSDVVEFGPAMPGWKGYIGTNQIDWILRNNSTLSLAAISIWGPDYPNAGLFQGQYFVIMQNSFPPTADNVPSLVQSGMIPVSALSLRFLTTDQIAVGFSVSFASQQIQLHNLGTAGSGQYVWGGDISPFAGQTGELRFRGNGGLDHIQFSNQPIPEPSVFGIFALGALLLGWRLRKFSRDK